MINSFKNNILKEFSGSYNNPLVNFIICGTQKGGTSALYTYLRMHQEICMSKQKEVHFFDNEDIFGSKKPNYDEYHSFFLPEISHKIIGEATPIYMYWHNAPKRIYQYNPKMKIIVILRNPIERAYSHWNMERVRGNDSLSFWDAIHKEKERCEEALPYQHRTFSYIDRGFYLNQLRIIWSYFPSEQVLILKNEDLKNKHREIIIQVYQFLGVKQIEKLKSINAHLYPYIAQMSSKEKLYLQSIYQNEIQNIEKELGWDCTNWFSL